MTVFGLKIRFYSKLVTINQTQQTIFLRVAVWKCWTEKKVFKWCKISAIQHDDFTQKEKFPAVQIRSRWRWSGRGFCAIFTSRIISESGTIFFLGQTHYVWFIMADICLYLVFWNPSLLKLFLVFEYSFESI